jgi:hypothetical protein
MLCSSTLVRTAGSQIVKARSSLAQSTITVS